MGPSHAAPVSRRVAGTNRMEASRPITPHVWGRHKPAAWRSARAPGGPPWLDLLSGELHTWVEHGPWKPVPSTFISNTGSSGGNAYLHLAIVGPYSGYTALAFAETAGKMWPADAVVGTLGSSGRGGVDVYRLTEYELPPPADAAGWVAFNFCHGSVFVVVV